MLGHVLNVLLNWLPKSRIFQKVIKKEQDELQKKVEGKYCYTELIHKFSNLTLSLTLANINEIFQNIYHIDVQCT